MSDATTQAKKLREAATVVPKPRDADGKWRDPHELGNDVMLMQRAQARIADRAEAILTVAITLAAYAKAQACGCVEYAGPDDYPCNRCKALAAWEGLFP